MKRDIGLITSCIIPNTNSGPITSFSKEQRIKSLVNNLNFISKNLFFNKVYIIDPFIKNYDLMKKFKSILNANGLIQKNINFIIFNPKEEFQKEIKIKGKGYSEMLMIIQGIKVIKEIHPNSIIHKISGRYKILNLKSLLLSNKKLLKKNIDLVIPFSRLLSKCYTVMYSFKCSIDLSLFSNCLEIINDSKKIYVEHSIYKTIMKKKIAFKRARNFIKLSPKTIGGSNQGSYTFRKQFINYIFYIFF